MFTQVTFFAVLFVTALLAGCNQTTTKQISKKLQESTTKAKDGTESKSTESTYGLKTPPARKPQ